MLNCENSSTIQELPEFVINQIKAGEVIERPSQLFKEVIENAIDAYSKNIEIKIRNNGLDLIQIKDDGIGISFQELPLAFKRHATSKIQSFSDIYEIYSFGFRGEALASISAVSKVECQSRPKESKQLGKILLEAGKIEVHEKLNSDFHGTLIKIKDLFYNTPVRLKFLKSQNAEKRAIQNILESFLISWHQINFTIQWDDEEKQHYPACQNPKDRIKAVMFKKKALQDQILLLNEEFGDLQVKGYFSPVASKGGYKKQHLFVNGRLFHDKALHFFTLKQMERTWGKGQSGHYFLLISIPADQIDVNIHPSKTHIKFEDDSALYSLISKGTKSFPQLQIDHHETSAANEQSAFNGQVPNPSGAPLTNTFHRPMVGGTNSNTSSPMSRASSPESASFLSISEDFFICRATEEQQQPLIIDKATFLANFLSQFLFEEAQFPPVPLIISDPFERNSIRESDIEALYHSTQIELEIVDENLLLLRSIPYCLTKLPYQKIIDMLLEQLNRKKKLDLDDLKELNYSRLLPYFLPHQIEGVMQDFNISPKGQPFALAISKNLFNHD